MQEAVGAAAKKIIKKPGQSYKDVLVFQENDKISLFKSKTFKTWVSVRLDSSHIRPII